MAERDLEEQEEGEALKMRKRSRGGVKETRDGEREQLELELSERGEIVGGLEEHGLEKRGRRKSKA